jgi:hypothetical protein
MATPEDPIIAGLLVAAIVVIAVVAIVVTRRNAGRRLEKLAPAFEFGTTRSVGMLGASVEGLFLGYTCRYTIETPSQYNPGGATLRLGATNTLQWSSAVEDFGSRLMARFGIVKDIQIGDAELDGLLRFSSGDEIALVGLFGQERPRTAMRRLATGEAFSSITVRADRVEVKWAPRRPELDEEPEPVRSRLEQVIDLLLVSGSSPTMG